MKAEIFVHTRSADRVAALRRLIAEEIDPDLPVEVHNVDTGRGSHNLEVGAHYSKLLQAAIPPELGLVLGVNSLSFLGERIYLIVYWPVVTGASGHRYDATVENFPPDRFDAFFPAVAVRDRMVLVPRDGGETLATVHGHQRFPTALTDQVREVDFADDEALRPALRAVAEDVARQLREEVAAWADFQPPGSFDLKAAGQDLDVDPRLLKRVMADRLQAVTEPYRRLEITLDRTRLPAGRWSRVVAAVTNSSDQPLDGVVVDVAGPVEVLPSRIEADLPPGQTVPVTFSLKPLDEGEFPIEITVVRPEDAGFSRWLRPVAFWLETGS